MIYFLAVYAISFFALILALKFTNYYDGMYNDYRVTLSEDSARKIAKREVQNMIKISLIPIVNTIAVIFLVGSFIGNKVIKSIEKFLEI